MPRRLFPITLFLFGAIGVDQASKLVAQDALRGTPTSHYLGDFFRLTYAENPGAFLGLGGSLPDWLRTVLFILFTGLLVIGMFYVLFKERVFGEPLTNASASALALLVAGGLGNLIDRIFRDGVVVDFMNMGLGGLRTGIFNVADVYIMVGAGMLALLSVTKDKVAKDKTVTEPPDGNGKGALDAGETRPTIDGSDTKTA